MKKLIRLAIVLVVLVVVALVAALIWIDQIARHAIERGGTYALGVDTTLDSADVRIFSGVFAMSGLHVANPEKFITPHFMTLNDGSMEVPFSTLRQDVVEVDLLELDGVDMHLERGDEAANYKIILANLKKLESEDDDDKEAKGFIIRKIVIRDVMVHVNLLPGGDLTRLDMPFDEIILEDVGSDTTGGMLLSELAGTIVKALLAAIVNKGGDLLPEDLVGELEGGLDQLTGLGEMGIDMAADLGKIGEDALKQAEKLEKVFDELGEIGDILPDVDLPDVGGIGNLLGGDDEE